MHKKVSGEPGRSKKRKILRWLLWSVAAVMASAGVFVAAAAASPSFRDWAATRILTDLLVRRDRLADVPARTASQPVRHVMVRMRDGVELSTQVYLPQGVGPWPVILVRDPYSFAQYLSCKVFVLYDYACVYQEVRGRGPSQGAWYPFTNERLDGLDTISWILEQPWQNRHLALQGGSYLGVVQWAVAGDLPPEVKTFVPTVSHGDVYELCYHNGLFNEGVAGLWLHSQFQPVTRKLTASGRWRDRVAGHFPALGVEPGEFRGAWLPYRDYLLHPEKSDSYWQSPEYVALREAHRKVRVPVLMIGYANDFFLKGMLQTFEELPTRDQSVLIIGPGNHGGQEDPEVDGVYKRDYADTIAWFDHYLRGVPLPVRLKPGINVFVHGDDKWRHYDRWRGGSNSLDYHLTNLAGSQDCDGGRLAKEPPTSLQLARYDYDPRHPTPTRGGSFLLLSDAVEDQGNDTCARADVLSFASEPLEENALLDGSVRVSLRVATDATDTSFSVKLSEHLKDGRVLNIRDDITALSAAIGASHAIPYTPGSPVEVNFELIPILWHLREGSRLRLDVSSSSAPAFFPHPNRSGLWSEISDPIVAHQTIYGGSLHVPVD